nr:hypothetical protein [Pseudomonas sp. Marseille-Q3773]
MERKSAQYIGIRGLMLVLLSGSVVVTLATCVVVAHRVLRDALIHLALESHKAYAYKVASGIGSPCSHATINALIARPARLVLNDDPPAVCFHRWAQGHWQDHAA